ncbi:MAG: hypothetical protein AB8B73_00245 [Ekhidna sp.]
MTLIANPSFNETSNNYENMDVETITKPNLESKELKVVTTKTMVDKSPMSDKLKTAVSKNAPDMAELLLNVVKQRGEESELLAIKDGTVNANGLSQMTLHLFALEAAKFGKTVTYKEEKTIIITD